MAKDLRKKEPLGGLFKDVPGERKPLRRKRAGITGVSAGLAEYFRVSPALVRLTFVVGAFLSSGIAALAYLGLAFLLPKEERDPFGEDGRFGGFEALDEPAEVLRERKRDRPLGLTKSRVNANWPPALEVCRKCSTVLKPDSRFCHKCGTPVNPSPEPELS